MIVTKCYLHTLFTTQAIRSNVYQIANAWLLKQIQFFYFTIINKNKPSDEIISIVIPKPGDCVLESSVHVNDGRWHLVEFSRRGQAVELKINERISADASLGVKPFQLDVAGPNPRVYLGGGPVNILEKSQAKLNLTGEIRELYFGNMTLLDYVVPVITDKRFETFGTVIDGSEIPGTSGSGGCDPFDDDEDAECGIPTETTTGQLQREISSI